MKRAPVEEKFNTGAWKVIAYQWIKFIPIGLDIKKREADSSARALFVWMESLLLCLQVFRDFFNIAHHTQQIPAPEFGNLFFRVAATY